MMVYMAMDTCMMWFVMLALSALPDIIVGCTTHFLADGYVDGIIISTPGYPHEFYNSSLFLCWNFFITSPTLSLTTKDTDMENSFDTLSVYDGVTDTTPHIITGRHRGVGTTYRTSGLHMNVRFNSDQYVTGYGFQACICSDSPSCACAWISGSNWSSWSDEDNYSESGGGLSQAGVWGLAVTLAALGIPVLVLLVMFCCTNKGNANVVDVDQDHELASGDSRGGQPKPGTVHPTSPPPYTPATAPPSYEQATSSGENATVSTESPNRRHDMNDQPDMDT